MAIDDEDVWETTKTLIEAQTFGGVGGRTYTLNPRGEHYNTKKRGTQLILREGECFHKEFDTNSHYQVITTLYLWIYAEDRAARNVVYADMLTLFTNKTKCRPPDVTGTNISVIRISGTYNTFGEFETTGDKEKGNQGQEYRKLLVLAAIVGQDAS